ncbi:MAG: hypothetical protein IPJ71_19560 [Bdellovibrionales bacterium]|nr:hypothetical protein [Bdellovibrionales bacterium]
MVRSRIRSVNTDFSALAQAVIISGQVGMNFDRMLKIGFTIRCDCLVAVDCRWTGASGVNVPFVVDPLPLTLWMGPPFRARQSQMRQVADVQAPL